MTSPVPPRYAVYWATFAATRAADPTPRFLEAFHFDDNEPSANELAALVLQGRKRATAALLWSHEQEKKPVPRPGDLSIVTDFAGVPQCVIETQRVDVVPFGQVSAEFAATEGEGDGSLAYWRRAHEAFFARECQRLGLEPAPDMPVVCERFEVVFTAAPAVQVVPFESAHQAGVIATILPIQTEEFGIPITLDAQPDLLDIRGFYQHGHGNFWVATCGSEVVGTVALLDIGEGQAALRKMFVRPAFRGREAGVAQHLLDTLLAWARERHLARVLLGTTDKFRAAHRFYEKNGFELIERAALPSSFPVMAVDSRFYALALR